MWGYSNNKKKLPKVFKNPGGGEFTQSGHSVSWDGGWLLRHELQNQGDQIGQYSPLVRLFTYFGQFLTTEIAQVFRATFSTVKVVVILIKTGIGPHLFRRLIWSPCSESTLITFRPVSSRSFAYEARYKVLSSISALPTGKISKSKVCTGLFLTYLNL
jgi:hypothetical protein